MSRMRDKSLVWVSHDATRRTVNLDGIDIVDLGRLNRCFVKLQTAYGTFYIHEDGGTGDLIVGKGQPIMAKRVLASWIAIKPLCRDQKYPTCSEEWYSCHPANSIPKAPCRMSL